MSSFAVKLNKLDSGLRAVLLPRQETASITLLVLIGVGSRYEPARQAGLSHFLEHMFFKGTTTRPSSKEIAEAIDNVGGEFNAFTGEEFTGFYVKVSHLHLKVAADVVSDILLRPLFVVSEIERERGVIMEEMNMYTEMPLRHVQHLWQKALFGSHPLGRRIDGLPETVKKIGQADLLSYTRRHYHSQNAVVVIAGNFGDVPALSLLNNYFSALPAGRAKQPTPAPQHLPVQPIVFESRPSLDQTHLIVGVPSVSINDDRRYAVQLLATILGGGMSSRLFISIRERRGLAYAVNTSADGYTDTGSLSTQVGARTDKAELTVKLILEEYDRVMNDLVSAKELNKAKEMARGHMLLELEETNALALFAGSQELLHKKILSPDEIWEKINAVTRQDIQKVAQELLAPGLRALALLSPHHDAGRFTELLNQPSAPRLTKTNKVSQK